MQQRVAKSNSNLEGAVIGIYMVIHVIKRGIGCAHLLPSLWGDLGHFLALCCAVLLHCFSTMPSHYPSSQNSLSISPKIRELVISRKFWFQC